MRVECGRTQRVPGAKAAASAIAILMPNRRYLLV